MADAPLASSSEPDYAWAVARIYGAQGNWSEARYLDLTDGANRHIEFTDGRLEFLPTPTEAHEALVHFLFLALYQFVSGAKLGKVYTSGIRLRVRPDKIRLPDVIFLHKVNFAARHNRLWDGADLAIEVVSDAPEDRQRDYEQKLADYAEGHVSEYWIVDPERQVVTVHNLNDGRYEIAGQFSAGQRAASSLLEGFAIDVAALFAEIDDIPE